MGRSISVGLGDPSRTCAPVPLLHPDVAVGLSYTCLRVQEGHEDAALSAQACIVTMTLFHCISVVLLSQPGRWKNAHGTREIREAYNDVDGADNSRHGNNLSSK